MKTKDWMMLNWKPMAALVYSLICIADFIVFPAWVGWHRVDYFDVVTAVSVLDPAIQAEIIRVAMRTWQPITLSGSGLFHVAFGALLTGAAVTRGPDIDTAFTDRGMVYRRRAEDVHKAPGPRPYTNESDSTY